MPATVQDEPRDYRAEYLAAFDAAIPASGSYVLPVLARELNARLRVQDPDLLAGWLDAHADMLTTDYLRSITRHRRAVLLARRGASKFAQAATRFAKGDRGAFGDILDTPYTVGETVVRLGDMDEANLLSAAADYEQTERSAAFERAFLEALAKRVKARTVSDVLTAEQVAEIRGRLA